MMSLGNLAIIKLRTIVEAIGRERYENMFGEQMENTLMKP